MHRHASFALYLALGLVDAAEARRGGRGGSGSYTETGQVLLIIVVSIAALYGLLWLLGKLLQTRAVVWLVAAMPTSAGTWERIGRWAVYAYVAFFASMLAWFAYGIHSPS